MKFSKTLRNRVRGTCVPGTRGDLAGHRFIADDVTPERLATLLRNQGALVHRAGVFAVRHVSADLLDSAPRIWWGPPDLDDLEAYRGRFDRSSPVGRAAGVVHKTPPPPPPRHDAPPPSNEVSTDTATGTTGSPPAAPGVKRFGDYAPTEQREFIRLVHELFFSREDVFAHRWWKLDKTGKKIKQYSPTRVWKGKKDKEKSPPRRLSLQDIAFHLSRGGMPAPNGREESEPIGTYISAPGPDGIPGRAVCRSFALDIDGEGWRDAAARYAAVCRPAGVPVYLERSQGGGGCHAWTFLDGNLSARRARAIAVTLAERAGLPLRRGEKTGREVDVLYPVQTVFTDPERSFGNLIALPLAAEPVARQCSVFLDPETLEPFHDQLGLLRSVARVPERDLEGWIAAWGLDPGDPRFLSQAEAADALTPDDRDAVRGEVSRRQVSAAKPRSGTPTPLEEGDHQFVRSRPALGKIWTQGKGAIADRSKRDARFVLEVLRASGDAALATRLVYALPGSKASEDNRGVDYVESLLKWARARLAEDAAGCPEYQHPEPPRVVSAEEAAEAIQRHLLTALAARNKLTLVQAGTSVGKTTGAIAVARDHPRPVAFITREHDLLDEVVQRARAAGVDAAKWPRLDDETCPAGRATEIEDLHARGFDATYAICTNCPHFPGNGGACPRLLAIAAVTKAHMRLIPTARLRPTGALLRSELEERKRFLRGAAVIFDEEPIFDLTREVVITPRGIEAFRALLERALADGKGRSGGASLDVVELARRVGEALTTLEALLNAAGARAVDLAATPCPKVDLDDAAVADAAGVLDRALARVACEDRGAPNLLPITLRATHHAHLGRPLFALRREGRIGLLVVPRLQRGPIVILDATAGVEAVRAVFPDLEIDVGEAIVLARPEGARTIQYIDKSYSRQTIKDAPDVERAAGIVAAAIRLHADTIERPRVGLISYMQIVDDLAEALLRELPDLQLEKLHFGALRGKNALEGVNVLVILGIPRPNPAALELRALAMGATAADLNGDREEVGLEDLRYGGERIRRFRVATQGPLAIAEEHAIDPELLQALGRQRLERHGGTTLVFTSRPLPLPKGWVEIRSARHDGLSLDPRRTAALAAFEARLLDASNSAPDGLTRAGVARATKVLPQHISRYMPLFLKQHPEFEEVGNASEKRVRRRREDRSCA